MHSTFLKVMGILCIIFGALGAIVSLVEFAGYKVIADQYGVNLSAAAAIDVITAIATIVAGILGCAFCSQVEKAIVCRIMGIILVVLKLASFGVVFSLLGKLNEVLTSYGAAEMSFGDVVSPVTIISALIVPVLYIIATFCYKQKNA